MAEQRSSAPDYSDGILFANTNIKSDSDPQFVGRVFVDGKRVNLLGWAKEDRKGAPQIVLKRKK